MKILVTGKNGQVAQSLAERAGAHGVEAIRFSGRDVLDLANGSAIAEFVAEEAPNVIVNTAAWTAVDDAEDNQKSAGAINAEAVEHLAVAAKTCGARVIHFSTDYVFDGQKETPYVESDPVSPIGVYGQTKLDGEARLAANMDEFLILRTAWVYSPFGKNFLKTMLAVSEKHDELTVVEDQYGNPTSALDLADAVFTILGAWREKPDLGLGEIYHCAGRGEASWADFARTIFNASKALGGPSASVTGIPTSQWPTKAARPANSRLDCSKLANDFAISLPRFEKSTGEVIGRLLDSVTGSAPSPKVQAG